MAGEWSDPSRVIEYLGREIPHRDVAEDLLLEALPESVERFADLGCGDGRLIALVRKRFPAANAIGLDSSTPMLVRAAARFEGETGVELREHDLGEPLSFGLARVDLVVSGLAIHHLEDNRKRALFAQLAALLRPGGVFANLDLVSSPTPEAHERCRRAIGREQDDPADRLAELSDQLVWLREAGFTEVDCPFKWRELTLITATTPTQKPLPGEKTQ